MWTSRVGSDARIDQLLGHGGRVEQRKNGGSKTGRNPAPSYHYLLGFMTPSKGNPWSRDRRGRGGRGGVGDDEGRGKV